MPALFYYSHSNMTLQSYRIIPEKQEKLSTEDELFYGMCQNPNCVNLTFEKGGTPCAGCVTLTFYIKYRQVNHFVKIIITFVMPCNRRTY